MSRLLEATTLFLLAICLALASRPAFAQQTFEKPPLRPGQMIELLEALETGLRARLPSEFAYLEEVVAAVQAGRLPEVLVRSTFIYARKKPRHPIRYFDRALRIRADRQGITNVPILPVVVAR